jgi:LPXTG-motif cell wall-anchored protein
MMSAPGGLRPDAGPARGAGIDRRTLLRAAAATSLVWAAPAVTKVTLPAAFAVGSPPPEGEVQPEAEVESEGVSDQDAVAGVTRTQGAALPATGAGAGPLLGLGAAAVAGGAASVYAGRRRNGDATGTQDAAETAEPA